MRWAGRSSRAANRPTWTCKPPPDRAGPAPLIGGYAAPALRVCVGGEGPTGSGPQTQSGQYPRQQQAVQSSSLLRVRHGQGVNTVPPARPLLEGFALWTRCLRHRFIEQEPAPKPTAAPTDQRQDLSTARLARPPFKRLGRDRRAVVKSGSDAERFRSVLSSASQIQYYPPRPQVGGIIWP